MGVLRVVTHELTLGNRAARSWRHQEVKNRHIVEQVQRTDQRHCQGRYRYPN